MCATMSGCGDSIRRTSTEFCFITKIKLKVNTVHSARKKEPRQPQIAVKVLTEFLIETTFWSRKITVV